MTGAVERGGAGEAPGGMAGAPAAPRSGRVALWVLVALCALVPLVNTNLIGFGIGARQLNYDEVGLPRFVLMVVGTALAWAAVLWDRSRSGEPLRVDFTGGLLGVLAVWTAASAVMSDHWALGVLGQSERLEGVVTVACYALLFGLGLQVVRDPRDARPLAVGLGIAAIFSSVIAVLQALGVDPMALGIGGHGIGTKAYATLGNSNFLAGFLVLVAPIALGLAFTSKQRLGKLGWAAAAVLVAVALVATYTRGAMVGAVVEIALVAVVIARGRVRAGRGAARFLVALVAVVVVLTAATFLKDAEAGSVSGRTELMKSALAAAGERPVVGYGPDAMLPAYREHRTPAVAAQYGTTYTANNVHSWPFQYAATLGWPGGLLLVAVLALGLWRTRRALGARGAEVDPLVASIAVGCVGFVVHMLNSVAMIGATMPFWLLLAVPAVAAAKDVRAPRTVLATGAALAVVVAVAAAAAGGVLLRADYIYLTARFEYHDRDYARSAADAEAAAALNPLSIKYRRGIADARIASVLAAITAKAPKAQVLAGFGAADQALASALTLDAKDYPSLAWRAALNAAVGEYTGDAVLAGRAVSYAEQAALLDVDHTQVKALEAGEASRQAVGAALAVMPTP